MQPRVLWISAAQPPAKIYTALRAAGIGLAWARSGAEALELTASFEVAAIFLNLPLGFAAEVDSILRTIHDSWPAAPIFVRQLDATIADAVRIIKLGAEQYFGMEVDDSQMVRRLISAIDSPANEAIDCNDETEPWATNLTGRSLALRKIIASIRLLAPRRCNVLITGETGTGKEIVARALHAASSRRDRPMLALNCSAIPRDLLESELFGHTKGAFTGAVANRSGFFEQADGGTLLLDEIGDMPVDLQTKLLRVLQHRELQRIGSTQMRKVDVRIIAATNADLEKLVSQGRFREDLYYRLNGVRLHFPALRERAEDIPLLARRFIGKICLAEGLPPKELDEEAAAHLCAYSWPGNVRQLENCIEAAVIMSGGRRMLE